MPRDDIFGALEYFGFDDIRVGNEEPDHPNGPAFSVTAAQDLFLMAWRTGHPPFAGARR